MLFSVNSWLPSYPSVHQLCLEIGWVLCDFFLVWWCRNSPDNFLGSHVAISFVSYLRLLYTSLFDVYYCEKLRLYILISCCLFLWQFKANAYCNEVVQSGSFKTMEIILSQFWRLEGQNQRDLRTIFLLLVLENCLLPLCHFSISQLSDSFWLIANHLSACFHLQLGLQLLD